MKSLLVAINSKYIHSNAAVYSLKAYAGKFDIDCEIEIAEYTINNQTDNILFDIYERKPDIIAFSCYIWNVSIIKELVIELKKVMPHIYVWIGGPEVSYIPDKFLQENPAFDGIMCGEGEETFSELLEAYVKSESLSQTKRMDELLADVKGIVYSDSKSHIVHTAPRPVIDMDSIPFPYSNISDFNNRIIYYETSRGCPFTCSYCLSSVEKGMRFKSIDIVTQELQFFLDNNVKQVKFVDRTFNCKSEHALKIWKYIIDNDNGITNFHFEIASDLLDDEQLQLFKCMRPGLIQLEIGVQTTNKKTLAAIGRKTNFNKLTDVVNYIRGINNIHQHLDLIAGLPYEDITSFEKSFNDVYKLNPNQLQLGFLKVLHGTRIAFEYGGKDIIFRNTPPYEVLSTQWLSFDELVELKYIEEVLEIYYNSGQFKNAIKYMEQHFESAFNMYLQLGIFYRGYSRNGELHSRISKYNILLEFMIMQGMNKEISTELVTLDVYLRENIKTRPKFCRNLDDEKDGFRDFYKNEAENKLYLKGYERFDYKQISKMTHIEVFERNPFEISDKGIDNMQKTYVLFDYINKDIINNEAKVFVFQNNLQHKIQEITNEN
ncbi:MAG: B12-binding domain-containing radical SAM protein [Eubacterium sp.]